MYKEYYSIVKDILDNTEFKKLKKESHHGTNRYVHSMRVSMGMYKITKKMNLDYKEATRASLLHDFFERDTLKSKMVGVIYEHPQKAYKNAKKYFEINKKQGNIIKCHMFPLSVVIPTSAEALLITLVDKKVAIYEYSNYKFNPKNIKNRIMTKPILLKSKI